MARIGNIELGTPLLLAPMAGVTNPPFRQLCREFADAGRKAAGVAQVQNSPTSGIRYAPSGLYTCEMITTRALVEENAETLHMVQPDPHDPVPSVQLYGVNPAITAAAVKMLIRRGYAAHIDLNFGCPVPKVTKKGGGSALPWKQDLFAEITEAAVKAAAAAGTETGQEVPVTAKIRLGIDAEHETFRRAAQIAAAAGISALTLHARTMEEHYSGHAHWEMIKELQAESTIPVFGNGDIFSAGDALEMQKMTGCAGVVVGRGCQGRPWFFFDLAAALHGSAARMRPSLREVAEIIYRHAELSVEYFQNEGRAVREMRKHMAWYLRGFSVGGSARAQLGLVSSLADLKQKLQDLDLDQSYPEAAEGKRGRAGRARTPHLPERWLESHYLTSEQRKKIQEAELNISGG